MKEITVKEPEILKINGKRVCIRPMDPLSGGREGFTWKIIEGKEEEAVIRKLLDQVFAKDMGISDYDPNLSDSNGSYFCIYDQDNLATGRKLYLKNIRGVRDYTSYGLPPLSEGERYILYYDNESEVYMFKIGRAGIISEVKNFKEDLLDGLLIK